MKTIPELEADLAAADAALKSARKTAWAADAARKAAWAAWVAASDAEKDAWVAASDAEKDARDARVAWEVAREALEKTQSEVQS